MPWLRLAFLSVALSLVAAACSGAGDAGGDSRHADERTPGAVSRLIENLPVDAPLELVPEPQNPHNPQALHLAADGKRVGWVPDYLLPEIHGYVDSDRPMSFTVVRANGPDAPPHLRLLCRVTVAPVPVG